jgi:hypothetical protein
VARDHSTFLLMTARLGRLRFASVEAELSIVGTARLQPASLCAQTCESPGPASAAVPIDARPMFRGPCTVGGEQTSGLPTPIES